MDAKGFGEYFKRKTFDRGMSQAYIGVRIGEWPPGSQKALNETGVRRIFEGGRKLDETFMWHLIRTFGLDVDEAWAAARVLPEGEGDHDSAVAAVKQYRKRHQSARRTQLRPVAAGSASADAAAAVAPVSAAGPDAPFRAEWILGHLSARPAPGLRAA